MRQKGLDGTSGNNGSGTKVEVSANSIKSSMEYLASDELNGRATGSDGIEKASQAESFWIQSCCRAAQTTASLSNLQAQGYFSRPIHTFCL